MRLRNGLAVVTSIAVGLFYLLLPSAIYSCGPIFPTAIFSYHHAPDFPLGAFLHGELGVVHPGLKSSYLFVAYRYLSNEPLNQDEQNTLQSYWQKRGEYPEDVSAELNRWLQTRKRVRRDEVKIEPYRELDTFNSFPNCQSDAFSTAAATLDNRIKQFGEESSAVKEWVRAQDTVFSNCPGGKAVPAEAGKNDPPVIRADREYQIGAAYFYSADFKAAEGSFHSIALDKSSEWSGIANYLEARAIVRASSFIYNKSAPEDHDEELERAEAILKRIVADPKLAPWHAMSRERIGLIEARLHPEERLDELSELLQKPSHGALLQQELFDFIYLLDHNEKVGQSDLAEWIGTMKNMGEGPQSAESAKRNFAKWKENRSLPWLIAAMASDTNGANVETLLPIAQKIGPDSPAYLSAAAYRARVKANNAVLAEVLKLPDEKVPTSARNRFLHEKLVGAKTFDEFLSAVPRKAADVVWESEDENYYETAPVSTKSGDYLFDLDSTRAFNRQLPLRMMVQAAKTESLTREIRVELARAAWTKAVLLDDVKAADELVPVVVATTPAMKPLLQSYLKETNPQRKHFAGVYAILHFPGITPVIHSGIGREVPIGEIGTFGERWWCGARKSENQYDGRGMAEDGELMEFMGRWGETPLQKFAFLDDQQKNAAHREWKILSELETAPNLLAKSVIASTERDPKDPRNPEALDLSLRALRYGCSDASYRDLSHKVFRVLHAKYPNSKAAKRNRPWG